jgi:hypothetical protein
MQSLPSLSRGRSGRVQWFDMNRVFRATEQLEALVADNRKQQVPYSWPRFAKLLGSPQSFSPPWDSAWEVWAWIEVRAAVAGLAWSWEPVPGSMTSEDWQPEGYALVPSGQAASSIVRIDRLPSALPDTGVEHARSWFVGHPVAGGVASTASGVVIGVTVAGNPETLGHPGYIVARHQNVSVDLFAANANPVYALNMAEIAGDLQSQVQNESPGTKTLLRLPIGTPVGPMSRMPDATKDVWCFTMPNAYQVVCA